MIKTILYDLDGTLRFNQPSGRNFFLDHAAALGVPVSSEDRRRVALWEHRYWAESADVLRDVVEFTEPDRFWTNYSRRQLEAAGLTAAEAADLAGEFHLYMQDSYQPRDVVLPETYEVLAGLRRAGFTLGVVSNRERPFSEYLTEKGLDTLVHFSVSGGEAGSKKPDRGIFDYALAKAGSRADETLYVGDNYFADVVGARGAGINPVLFDPEGVFDGWPLNGESEAHLVTVGLSPSTTATPPLRANQVPVIRSHPELLTLLDGANLSKHKGLP